MTSLPASLAAAALLALLPAGAAWAQNNTITIEQTGDGNKLTVDQSNAAGSKVGGLTLLNPLATASGLSLDSMGKQVFTETIEKGQTVKKPVVGFANYQAVTFDRQNPVAALQSGSRNQANITVSGVDGFVGLSQQNQNGALGNTATVTLNGNGGTALIGQLGFGNTSTLNVTGLEAQGSIIQSGNGNTARLDVSGERRSGSISQLGNGNNSSLEVTSVGGPTSVDYIVQGNNIVNASPLTGVSVFTNSTSVTITQTALGSP